jgi:hypothetical protein
VRTLVVAREGGRGLGGGRGARLSGLQANVRATIRGAVPVAQPSGTRAFGDVTRTDRQI